MMFVSVIQSVATRTSYGPAPILLVTLTDVAKVFNELGHVSLLCSPKNFGGAYSRRFVRASVRPCVRASVRPYVRVSVRPCVRPALVHANSRKLLVGFQ